MHLETTHVRLPSVLQREIVQYLHSKKSCPVLLILILPPTSIKGMLPLTMTLDSLYLVHDILVA